MPRDMDKFDKAALDRHITGNWEGDPYYASRERIPGAKVCDYCGTEKDVHPHIIPSGERLCLCASCAKGFDSGELA